MGGSEGEIVSADPDVVETEMIRLERQMPPRPARVALLRPPTVVALDSMSACGPTPPVGMAYIAAALRDAGHEIQIIDSPAEAMETFEHLEAAIGTIRRIGLTPNQMVDRIRPDTAVIGITHMFSHEWPTVRQLAEACRARFPDSVIVVGGENATGFWPWIFEQTSAIDVVVLGEGDATAVELVNRVSAGVPFHGMQGIVTRPGLEPPVSGGLPVRFKKLDSIPRPAWDLFPMDAYFRYRSFLGVDHGASMPILATRGCPYKCTFCSSPQMWTTRYVVREPEDVADEIADYVERFGVRNVEFVDLTPVTKRSWTLRLCDAIEARHLDISLQMPIGTRSEAIDEEVLVRLKAAGVTNITFAPESGSERMLEVYDKRADLEHILEAVRQSSRAGMVTSFHMIVGHPAETWKDRWLSWKYMQRAARAGVRWANSTGFYPYPGSKDFTTMVEDGRLRIDDDYCYDSLGRGHASSQSFNKDLSPKALHWLQIVMAGSTLVHIYLRHPSQFVHFLRSVFLDEPEETVPEQIFRTRKHGPLSRKARGLVIPPTIEHATVAPSESAA